jgi:hypothetical protein
MCQAFENEKRLLRKLDKSAQAKGPDTLEEAIHDIASKPKDYLLTWLRAKYPMIVRYDLMERVVEAARKSLGGGDAEIKELCRAIEALDKREA